MERLVGRICSVKLFRGETERVKFIEGSYGKTQKSMLMEAGRKAFSDWILPSVIGITDSTVSTDDLCGSLL